MKKISIYLLLAFGLVTSCVNEMDEIFDQSAAERLNNTQAKYSKLLTSSANGWAFEFYPTSSADDGAVLYALKFMPDGSVDVAGDPYNRGDVVNEVSCWDIIADNGPVLSFSTYNTLIHQFSDPMDDGAGYEGDYEFAFVYSETENPDSVIVLKGKKRGLYSRLKMIDEAVSPAEYLTDITTFQKTTFPATAPNYLLVNLVDSTLRMDDIASTVPQVYPFGKDAVLFAKTNSYITTKYGGRYALRFNRPFTTTDGVKCSNFVFNPSTKELVAENDSRVKIYGPEATDFLYMKLNSGSTIAFNNTAEMSDNLTNLLKEVKTAFSDVKYTYNNMQFKATESGFQLFVSYRNANKQSVTTVFKYELAKTADGKISFKYVGPATDAGEKLLGNLPQILDFLKALEGDYTVESTTTPLDLTKVKFESGSEFFIVSPQYTVEDNNNESKN